MRGRQAWGRGQEQQAAEDAASAKRPHDDDAEVAAVDSVPTDKWRPARRSAGVADSATEGAASAKRPHDEDAEVAAVDSVPTDKWRPAPRSAGGG